MDNLRIVYKKVQALAPYALNARTHSDAQIDMIANSIQQFGFVNPILVGDDGTLIAGHGRLLAARQLGMDKVPTVVLGHLSERQRRALVLADNAIALKSGWDMEKLGSELSDLAEMDFNLDLIGFDEQELDTILKTELAILPAFVSNTPDRSDDIGSVFDRQPAAPSTPEPARPIVEIRQDLAEDDPDPEVPAVPVSEPGDIWILGNHRVMCGDSTSQDDAARLMAGQVATLVHADPPYGMGKEADGVANDNLYRDKLDAFQMAWWRTFRPYLTENASAYIWGNAEELWRLWFLGGLSADGLIEVRNEIVWDKKNIPGMASPDMTSYPIASERCLFIQIGKQWVGSVNTDDYFDAWDNVRVYLKAEADRAEITPQRLTQLCGVGMYSHWFTKSQWVMIPERHYQTLAAEYPGCFTRPWSELKQLHREAQGEFMEMVKSSRSYFNNTHDNMIDVWDFPRVVGGERHGHSTPKPVAMMERAVKSSSRMGDLVIEPFGGSGATLIACEKTGRRCATMELVPSWVDVIVRRWEHMTGLSAIHEDGRTFEEVKQSRQAL